MTAAVTSDTQKLRYCDLVMKGGVTSGVIYPSAAVAISKKYQFRNIGGTSAGAIAASLTAAAESCRQNGSPSGFAKLAELPEWLRTNNNLTALFRPDRTTRFFFELVSALAGRSGETMRQRCIAALSIGIRRYWWTLAALVPAIVIAAVAVTSTTGGSQTWLIAAALFLFLFGAVVAIVFTVLLVFRGFTSVLPQNLLGLCAGIAAAPPGEAPTLTNWLSQALDETAGTSDPLTFGKLWGDQAVAAFRQAIVVSNQAGAAPYDPTTDDTRTVNLAMISSNITFGRPFTLPFDLSALFFEAGEFRRLFPERVVTWMIEHPRKPPTPHDADVDAMMTAKGKLPFPDAADMPVVVATRMSLSFPLLISAVPLWAIDFNRPDNKPKGADLIPEHCWFSDGGLASNFPIHFFDAPLPRWPTFAIDLAPFPLKFTDTDPDGQCGKVWMPDSNGEYIMDVWDRIDHSQQHPSLFKFVAALLDTMQNWSDNSLAHAPGYRDRIVQVYLHPIEGGLNLRMDPEVLKDLSERGTCAGKLLRQHFDESKPPEMTWDNHRWIRYRSYVAAQQRLLARFQRGYSNPIPPDRSYAELVARPAGDPPSSYQLKGTQKTDADGANAALIASAGVLNAANLAAGAPRPSPDLRMRRR